MKQLWGFLGILNFCTSLQRCKSARRSPSACCQWRECNFLPIDQFLRESLDFDFLFLGSSPSQVPPLHLYTWRRISLLESKGQTRQFISWGNGSAGSSKLRFFPLLVPFLYLRLSVLSPPSLYNSLVMDFCLKSDTEILGIHSGVYFLNVKK